MQRNPTTLIEVLDDDGRLVFKAIHDDKVDRLKDLIRHGADINSKQEDYNCLQFAAKLGRWECALILIDAKMSDKYASKSFITRAGMALLLASKENQQGVVEALFQLAGKFPCNDHDEILFKPLTRWESSHDRPTILWKDETNKYTALHWAVINNNPAICKLFITFTNARNSSYHAYGADHKIYRTKDKNGLNALNLAISLNHLECAREIAKGMSILYMLEHSPHEILYKIMLNDIRFQFRFSGHHDFSRDLFKFMTFQSFGLVDEKIQLVLKHIFFLPIEDKKSWLSIALDNKTTLGGLIEYSAKRKKYQKLLASELKEIIQSELDIPLDDKKTLEKKNSSHSLDSNDFESATKLVPIYIRTTDLYARLPQVPSHSLKADSASSCEEDSLLIRKLNS